jgi:hypothetical protein
MEAVTIKNENLSIPESLEYKDRNYTLGIIKSDFCYMTCSFYKCTGNIKYYFATKTICSWRGHCDKCRKDKNLIMENKNKSHTGKKGINNNLQIIFDEYRSDTTIKKEYINFEIAKLEELNFLPEKKKINPYDYMKKAYQSCVINIEKAKPLYMKRLPGGAKSLIAKVIKNNGKTVGLFVDNCVVSSVSYIKWKIKGIKFLEIIILATDENFAGKGMGKHLTAELMTRGKLVAWSDIGALEFYKKLGWIEDNVLGWELSSELSYATYSVFVHYGISEEERIKLIE